ncbi:MAG: 50S ribosomal protein L6 [Candidatus Omnitrophota bacterium]
MSRVGKVPVIIPKGVKVAIEERQIRAEGPKGKLAICIPMDVKVENKENKLVVNRLSDSKQARANFGTIRVLLANMMIGVTEGHKKNLEIQGVGFRAQLEGKKLILNLGLSHPVDFLIPEGVSVKTKKPTEIEIEGIDKALVGNVASKLRQLKPAEPYKGKGIRYLGEIIRRKQGKSVTK